MKAGRSCIQRGCVTVGLLEADGAGSGLESAAGDLKGSANKGAGRKKH